MNQIRLTKRFIEDLETIISMASINCDHMINEIGDQRNSVMELLLDSVENCNLSIASVKDFIHRATTNEYGEKIN